MDKQKWYIHRSEYYSVMKRNELLLLNALTQTYLKNIMPSDKRQTQKTIRCIIPKYLVMARQYKKQISGYLQLGVAVEIDPKPGFGQFWGVMELF